MGSEKVRRGILVLRFRHGYPGGKMVGFFWSSTNIVIDKNTELLGESSIVLEARFGNDWPL